MEETVNKRLKTYSESKNIEGPDIYAGTKLTRQAWSDCINSDKSIPSEKLSIIVAKLKNINARWLLTGEGPMEEENMRTSEEPALPYNTIESLKEKVASLEKDKEFLQQSLLEALRQRGAGCPGETPGGVAKPGKTG